MSTGTTFEVKISLPFEIQVRLFKGDNVNSYEWVRTQNIIPAAFKTYMEAVNAWKKFIANPANRFMNYRLVQHRSDNEVPLDYRFANLREDDPNEVTVQQAAEKFTYQIGSTCPDIPPHLKNAYEAALACKESLAGSTIGYYVERLIETYEFLLKYEQEAKQIRELIEPLRRLF